MRKTALTLIADIGATNSRVAQLGGDDLFHYHSVTIYKSADFNAPDEIIQRYCLDHQIKQPDLIVLAIAAPIEINEVEFANNHWRFKLSDIKSRLLPSEVYFYNDVEMLGLALPLLSESSLVKVGNGHLDPYAPKLALSLGSGVGTSLVIHHHDWFVIPSEGGHSNMMIDDGFVLSFLKKLKKADKNEIIIEDFIAGRKGIPQLIEFVANSLGEVKKNCSPIDLVDQLVNEKNAFAKAVFHQYCAMIGTVAKNYILITGARSVYIAGGIIPRFLEFFINSSFRTYFEESSSMKAILKNIPTFVITDPYPALLGLAQKVVDIKESTK